MSLSNERLFPHRWIRTVPGIKARDMLVWWYLSQRQGTDAFIRTTKADIADFCKSSVRRVDESLGRLRDAKTVEWSSGQTRGKPNEYSVLVPEWVEPYDKTEVGTKETYPQNGHGGTSLGAEGYPQNGRTGRSLVATGKDLERTSLSTVEEPGEQDLDSEPHYIVINDASA